MRLSITQRPQEMLQRRSAFQFMSHRFYDVISFGGRALPAVAQVGAGRLGAMKVLRHCLVLLEGTVSGCVTSEEPFPSEMQADTRATPVLRIEEKIREMVHVSREWEMAQFRAYRQQDIDGDRVDDAILLTTFEHGNYWRRELFVCLSSCRTTVLHTNLGGKG